MLLDIKWKLLMAFQNIIGGRVVSSGVVRGDLISPRTTLPEDGNVMPKHIGATIHN